MIRYLVGFLGVCALLGTLPRSASAEADEEPVPSSEKSSEEPALQLGLTPAGVDIAPSSPRTDDGYTLEEMDVRVRRAKIGLGSSAAVLFAGGMFLGFGMSGDCGLEFCFGECTPQPKRCGAFVWTGTALSVGGFAGMIASGILLHRRKRDRDSRGKRTTAHRAELNGTSHYYDSCSRPRWRV